MEEEYNGSGSVERVYRDDLGVATIEFRKGSETEKLLTNLLNAIIEIHDLAHNVWDYISKVLRSNYVDEGDVIYIDETLYYIEQECKKLRELIKKNIGLKEHDLAFIKNALLNIEKKLHDVEAIIGQLYEKLNSDYGG